MIDLKPLPATELTSYVIDLLAKYEITTVEDFLNTDIADISKKTNLNIDCIKNLQAQLRSMHTPARINLLEQFRKIRNCHRIYGFGIECLDELLGPQTLSNKSVFEIYGIGGIGKSKFCHTVVLNVVRQWKIEALYIDTKQDFSASCLYQMMRKRQLERAECGQIMHQIKVEKAMTLHGVLNVLLKLQDLLKISSTLVSSIKFIVIDALPAVWFTLNGEEDNTERKYILSKVGQLIHKLAKEYFIATLIVNLALQEDDTIGEYEDTTELNIETARNRQPSVDSNSNDLPLKPLLGRYWSSIPLMRLCLKMPENADEYATERLIEITRNSYGPTGGSCCVDIRDIGVVS